MRAFLLLLATLLEIAVFYVPALILTVALLAILWDVIRRAIKKVFELLTSLDRTAPPAKWENRGRRNPRGDPDLFLTDN